MNMIRAKRKDDIVKLHIVELTKQHIVKALKQSRLYMIVSKVKRLIYEILTISVSIMEQYIYRR